MNPLTKIVVLVDGRDNVGMEIARERGGELDSLHTGCRHRAQQTTERRRSLEAFQAVICLWSITVYVLPDQVNFAIAVQSQLVYFRDDVGRQPAFLTTAGKRHDAVSTKLVTALDDRYEGDIFRRPRGRRDIPHFALRAFIQVDNSSFTVQRSRNQLWQTIRRASSDHDVNGRACIKDGWAFELSHTAHDADHWLVADSLATHFADARKNFVSSALAHRARVENNYVSVFR